MSRRPPNSARQQRIEIGGVAHHAGDLAGRVARAGEEVAARRPGDGRAGVLRDHQPPERSCRRKPSASARRCRRACRMCAAAGRPRSSGPASAAPWPRRSGRVPDRRPAPRGRRCRSGSATGSRRRDRMRLEPGADRLHRHLFERDFAEIGQDPAGPGKALAGFGGVGDALRRPSVIFSRAAPWTWMKKASTLSASQAISRPLPGKRALLDRGTVEIFDQPGRRFRREGEIGIHAGRPVGVVDVDEIGRPRQQRHGNRSVRTGEASTSGS